MKTAIALLIITIFGSHISKADGGLLLYTRNGSSYVNAVKYKAFLIWNGVSYVTSESFKTQTESARSSPSAHLFYVVTEHGHQIQLQPTDIVANLPYPHSPTTQNIEDTNGDAKRMVDNIASLLLTMKYSKYETLLIDAGIRWSRLVDWGDSESDRNSYRDIDLWNRYLELCKSNKTIKHSKGSSAIIPILHTKSGEIFTNVTILRFQGDKAVIQYTAGIGQILISELADIDSMPKDVISAIRAAQKVLNEQKRRELPSRSRTLEPPLSTSSVKTTSSPRGNRGPARRENESGASLSSTVPGN